MEMQICANASYVVTLTLSLDLLNPKSIGFKILPRTTIVPSFKSF